MGTGIAIAIALAVAFAAGGKKKTKGSSSGPNPSPTPPPKQDEIDPQYEGNDPTIGPDGYPQIVFYEDGSWDEPTEDWFAYAEERIANLLPAPDANAPEPDYGEFDFPYIVAWDFMRGEVPEGAPYPDEPYAPNAEMWPTQYPGVNYFDGPDATLFLIEHIGNFIEAALPHYNETGELILLAEEG